MLALDDLRWQEVGAALAGEWEALLNRADLHPSLGPGWLHEVARSHGFTADLRVAVARDESALAGVLPYLVRKRRIAGIPMSVVEPAGNVLSYHQELVAPGREADLLRAFLCGPGRRWHAFLVVGVPCTGPTARALEEVAEEVGSGLSRLSGEASPYLPIEADWQSYLASRSGNFRSNLRRKERALSRAGDLQERWFVAPEDVEELYAAMIEIEAHSWKAREGIAVSSREHEQRYYRGLLPWLAARRYLFANVLYLDSEPVAYHLCYAAHGKVGNLKTSFKEEHASRSPGAVVIARAIQRAFESGAREFDFHGGTQHHKRLWTEHAREHETLTLFSKRLRARAAALLKKIQRAASQGSR